MIYKEFSIEHNLFYEEFGVWRKDQLISNYSRNGVYQLLANRKINRLLGSDELGILYIGKGDILSNKTRVGKLINAINQTENAHDGGFIFNQPKIIEKYPLNECTIRITLDSNSELLGASLLNEYLNKYGELPPFNRRSESINF